MAQKGERLPLGYSKCVDRTVKDTLLWVRFFETIAKLAVASREFRRRQNERWLM
jgi:hypothetical protein